MNCCECKNYLPKEDFKEGDVFIDKINRTLVLSYVCKGSFLPLYSKAGEQHSFYMGGYTFMDGGFRIGGYMCYTIEELMKHHKMDELKKVGHVEISAWKMAEELARNNTKE